MVELGFVDRLVRALRENRLLVAGSALAAIWATIQALLQPIQHPVWRDVALCVILTVLCVGTVRTYIVYAMPSWLFAKTKLKQNSFVYTLSQTWPSLVLTVSAVGAGLSVFGAVPIRSLADHMRPDLDPPIYCLRVAVGCRSCVSLIDIAGRRTGPSCLKIDAGGLAQGQLDRWGVYRAAGATADCSGQTVTREFMWEDFETCHAYLAP